VVGGVSHAEVKDFDLKGIVSFERAYAEASGSFDPRRNLHDSSLRVVVEGTECTRRGHGGPVDWRLNQELS
jgi:hypothetical protein